MTWPPFLRDRHGTIVLEEVDEDTGTATFRVYGRSSVTARRSDAGVAFDGDAPSVLRAALAPPPPAFGRFVAASRLK
jgi:hypothetical protein